MNRKQWWTFAILLLVVSTYFWNLGQQAYFIATGFPDISDGLVVSKWLIYNRAYFWEALSMIMATLGGGCLLAGYFEKEEGKKK